MVKTESSLAVRIIRWTARILASIASLIFVVLIVSNTFWGSEASPVHLEIPNLVLALLVIVLGLLLTWWDDLPAGIFMATLSAVVGAMGNLNSWLVFGTSFLAAGMLFILAWLIGTRQHRRLHKARLA
jgi:hypothetical protein